MGTIFIQILIQILLVSLCISVVLLVSKLNKLFKKKNIEIEQELLTRVVGVAVSWVEHEYGSTKSNEEKYQLVYDYVTDKLYLWDCNIDPEDVQKIIGATLNTFKRLKKEE